MSIHDRLIAAMTPGLVAQEVVIGAHLIAVRSGDRLGLATAHRSDERPHQPTVTEPGRLAGRTLEQLAGLIHSRLPLEAAVAMAAINAALPVDGLQFSDRNGLDLILERAGGKTLVLVGHFNFVPKLRDRVKQLHVLELDPQGDDLPADRAREVIPQADVVAITASAFANRTIDGLLELAREKWTVVLGPTSPLSPILFDYGVNAVAGALPDDLPLALQQVREGAIFKQLTAVRRVLLLP